ncbi:MAG: PQQ-dependent sugar dehydrogenase [Pseudomonadota bacterium]|nr:PQQ-dependent sugar dehydrogenase [Pseudomonadota bacterium]
MQRGRIQALIIAATLTACSAGPAKLGAASRDRPFTTTKLATFNEPFALVFLGDGSALVTEKAGHLKYWRAGQAPTEVEGVPTVKAGGQGGLLDVALSPGFASDHLVYLTYSEPSANGGNALALARGALASTSGQLRLEGVRLLWHDSQGGNGGQFGGVIAFAPDGRSLFMSSGERQRFTPAQDPNQPLGKILHLTPGGQPAPGNPWASKTGAPHTTVIDPPQNTDAALNVRGRPFAWPGANRTPAETWSTGHRNPYGLAFDADGRLWESEMGPKGGDELNLIKPGLNYGWPKVSNGSNYDGSYIPPHQPGDGYEPPRAWWNPSISPAGLMIYSGEKWPHWKGDAFLPALSGQALIRVHLSGDAATKSDQWDMGTRIRAVAQDAAGNIYLLEDGAGARLLRLDPAPAQRRR